MFRLRSLSALALPALALLAGCSTLAPTIVTSPAALVHGDFHGGQQPVVGAQIQLYTVGTTADGAASTPLLATPVLTQANGSFNFTLSTPCPSASALVYLAATGGNPGLGGTVNNAAISALTAIGTCTDLANTTYLSINEVTTAAMVSAAAPYLTGVSAIGSTPAHASALAAAFTLATQFASTASGRSPGVNLPAGYTAPQALLYTLADAIAPCVNSNGTDGNCATLFGYLTPPNQPAPTDIVGALLNLANNPSLNTANLYSLAVPTDPIQPILAQAPAKIALALIPTTTTLSFSTLTFPSAASTFPTPQQDLVVTNTGSQPAVFTSTAFTISGTNASDFDQVNSCTTLAPGASCDVLLIATPSATGTRTATLTPSANLTQPQSVSLTVTGTAPSAGLIKTNGGAAFRTEEMLYDVVVTNSGTTPMTFKAPTGADSNRNVGNFQPSISANTCVGTIAAGATCIITVATSSLGNNDSEYLVIVSDAAAGNYFYNLYSSFSYDMTLGTAGTVPLGSSSAGYISVNSANTGYQVNYSGATVTGANAKDYTLSASGCTGSGSPYSGTYKSCSFSYTFIPSAAGPRDGRVTDTSGSYLPLGGIGGGQLPGTAFSLPASASLTGTLSSSNTATDTGSVTLTNTGSTTLTSPSIRLFSKTAPLFSQTNNCASVAPGATCTISLSYQAPSSTAAKASLTVTDPTSGLSKTIPIAAYSSYPLPTLSPATVAFGTQNDGTTTTKTFTVSNNGAPTGRPVSITKGSDAYSEFSFPNGTTCAASTTAVCTFTVAYTPAHPAAASVSFTATDTVSGNSVGGTLTGTGNSPGPYASFSGSAFNFPATVTGSSSTMTVTLTNQGNSTLNIASFSLTGGASFGLSNACATTLAAGASCKFGVVFTPQAQGTFSGSLTFNSDSPNSPTQFPIYATGNGPTSGGVPAFSATSISLGQVAVGSAVGTNYTLTNSGSAALIINSVALANDAEGSFSSSTNCPKSLAINGTCTIYVTLQPKSAGTKNAVINTTVNNSSAAYQTTVSGTGK